MKGVSNIALALTLIGIVGVSSVAVYLAGTQFAISPCGGTKGEGQLCDNDNECYSCDCRVNREVAVPRWYQTSDYTAMWDIVCPSTYSVSGETFPVTKCIANSASYICINQYTQQLNPGETIKDYCTQHNLYCTNNRCYIDLYYNEMSCAGIVCGDGIVSPPNEECDPAFKSVTTCDPETGQEDPTGVGTMTCNPTTCQWSTCVGCDDDNPCTIDNPIGNTCEYIDIDAGTVGTGRDNKNCGGYFADCKKSVCEGDPSVDGDAKCILADYTGEASDCSGTMHCVDGNCVSKPGTCGNDVCESNPPYNENANNCPGDCNPFCGNDVTEPGEECDNDSPKYDTEVCYDGGCQGAWQIREDCIDCIWEKTVLTDCEKDDLCCGITCPGGDQRTCTDYCALDNKWCDYLQTIVSCNDYCANGQCIDCIPSDCDPPNCQLILNKCGVECVTPNQETPCSLATDNCGYKTCQSNGKYGSCYAKQICIDTHECVDEAGIFTCLPKDVRVTHTLDDFYSIGENIIFTATIPYTPSNHPIQSDLMKDTILLQSVECSNIGGTEWGCIFTPVSSSGIYKVKTSLTHPSTGSLVTKEDTLIVRESLVVRFTTESLIQYVGQDIITKLEVQPSTITVSKALSAKFCTGLCLIYNDITLIPNWIPTGGNTWDVVIPSGQITQKGMLQLTMTVEDAAILPQYEPVTKTQTLEIAKLDLEARIEAPSSVNLASGSKTEQLIVKTYLGNDLVDVDRLEMRVTYAGNEQMFTKQDFIRLEQGKYQLSFTFTQSQNHYFRASAWLGFDSDWVEVSVPVTGGPACACDVTANICDEECACDPDCTPPIPWVTYGIVATVVGSIIVGGAFLWKRG